MMRSPRLCGVMSHTSNELRRNSLTTLNGGCHGIQP